MENYFTWKRKFFSHALDIYQGDNKVGEIRHRAFSWSSDAELKGRSLLFEIKGFFRNEKKIIDQNNGAELTNITIGNWRSKATFAYNGREYLWQYDNFWGTKFSITTGEGPVVKYHAFNFGGDIESHTSDEVLILTGLLIKNYFKQRAATAAAAT